jgi:hypothetical protein
VGKVRVFVSGFIQLSLLTGLDQPRPDHPPPSAPASPSPPAPLAPAPSESPLATEPPQKPRRRQDIEPGDMALRGRIGAYRLHATHDPRETTQKARETFLARFEREVDPDGTLPEAERLRRAEYARRAYFARLARSRRPGHRHHRGSGRRAAYPQPQRHQRGSP